MLKQTLLSRWLQPVSKPVSAQSHGSANVPSLISAPQRRTTLLDVLSELDVNALRSIVSHLEAANWCGPVRGTCKALRNAVNTGMTRVRLQVPLDEDEPLLPGRDWQSSSPLLKWPSCTKLQLAVYGRRDDSEDEGEDEGAEDEAAGEAVNGLGAPAGGGEGGSAQEDEAGAGERGPAATCSQEPGQLVPQLDQPQGLAGVDWAYPRRGESATQLTTRLATWPFLGLPAARREQITQLELRADWGCPEPINLSHVVEALGPLLPGLQHLDLVHSRLDPWLVAEDESERELHAALAAAFPRLLSVALPYHGARLSSLVTHLGSRLCKLELTERGWSRARMDAELLEGLPLLAALKELVLRKLRFDSIITPQGSFIMWGVGAGDISPSERAFKRLLDAMPPALESLHLEGFELETSDQGVGVVRGSHLELGVRGGKAHTLRVGWSLTHGELHRLDQLLLRSKLGQGVARLELLQLAGLQPFAYSFLLGDPNDYSEMWAHLATRFQFLDIGRLWVEGGMPFGSAAALAERYAPEEVAWKGCVVRLRGRGPPPSSTHVVPQWRLELGGVWAEGLSERDWGLPAPGVVEVVAAGRLQLETATAAHVAGVALGALRQRVKRVVAAAAAAPGMEASVQERVQGCGQKGGLALGEQHRCGDLLLLVGPFVGMLGSIGTVDVWVRELCQKAARRRQQQEPLGSGVHRTGPDVEQYARMELPLMEGRAAEPGAQGVTGEVAGGAAGARAGAGVPAGAAGPDVVLLLQGNARYSLGYVEEVLQEQCGARPAGSVAQGMSPGLRVVRLEGRSIAEVLHDAYLSPVRIGARYWLEALVECCL